MMVKARNISSVANLIDCFTEAETFYMLSECVKGEPLRQIVLNQRKTNLKEHDVRKYIQSVLKIVKQLHSQGI